MFNNNINFVSWLSGIGKIYLFKKFFLLMFNLSPQEETHELSLEEWADTYKLKLKRERNIILGI